MKTRILLATIASIFLLNSCGKSGSESQPVSNHIGAVNDAPVSGEWSDRYDRVEATEIPDNAIQLIGKDWMLVTAGKEDSFNSMTASWGALGEIWSKPVSLITVRDIRYTYQFIETNDTYTLCFFTEEFRGALNIMGSKSGRDTDKVKEAGLTPVATPSGNMGYAEARMILECKKLYADPLNKDAILDKSIIENTYEKAEKAMHTLYIGEIVNVWIKK